MAEARSREAWAHTSAVLAMLANVNRDPKRTRAFKPSDFDPHTQRATATQKNAPIGKGRNFDILKLVFIDAPQARKGTNL